MTPGRADEAASLRVAYLTGSYPAISHTFILREIAALRAAGVEVHPFSIRRTPPDQLLGAAARAEAAVTFNVLDAARNPLRLVGAHLRLIVAAPRRYLDAMVRAVRLAPPEFGGALYQLFYFLEAGVVADALRRRGVPHIHNHFADSSCTVSLLASVMAGARFSFSMHGPTEFFAARRWRLDLKVERAVFVAAISHFCRSQLMLFADPEHWPKIRIVHCGVDPDSFRASPPPEGQEILFLGRLSGVKGARVLLEAFARVRRSRPAARLTLAGDGPERPALEALARDLGLADAVAFPGAVAQDDVPRLMARCAVFALPSFAEGVPVVLMEAMASGRPVISTRIAGIPELVEDGVSGFLVPPGDVDSLADRLAAALDDPDLRARMGAAGRARVLAEFDLARETARLRALFAGAAAGALPEGLRS